MKIFNHDKCEKEKQEILKTFENTILKVLESIEKTNNKFYEMAAEIEKEHFKQLEIQSANHARLYEKISDKLSRAIEEKPRIENNLLQELEEKISRIKTEEPNIIEKEEELESPLQDFDPNSIGNIKNLQFDGEEEIYPIS